MQVEGPLTGGGVVACGSAMAAAGSGGEKGKSHKSLLPLAQVEVPSVHANNTLGCLSK